MRLRKDLLWEQLDDEVIVLDLEKSMYLKVDGSGALLWTVLKDSAERAELISALVEAYEIDEARAASDVDDFTESLRAAGLLEA
ncbi:MAG: PqqD family protein [Nitriliruptorales bacterium]